VNKIVEAARKAYPSYANVSDDDLIAAIGQAYPVYLDQQKYPEFTNRFAELDEDRNFNGGFIDGITNAIRRGVRRAEMADLVFDEGTYGMRQQTPESIKRIAELNDELSNIRGSSALQYYSSEEAQQNAPARYISMFGSFPEFLAESLTSQIIAGADIIPEIFGTTVATGAAMGAISPDPVTTLGGAGFGAMFGLAYGNGITSLAQEYTGTVMEVFAESGVDTTNAEQLTKLFNSEEGKAVLEDAKKAAYSRGVPIAVLDALSFGIAGRLGSVGKEMLLQSTMGATGELAAQETSELVTGQRRGGIEDVIIEAGVGAFADTLTDVVPARLAKTGKLKSEDKAELEKLFTDISERQAEIDQAEAAQEDAVLEQIELDLNQTDELQAAAELLSEKVAVTEQPVERVGTVTPVIPDTEDGKFKSEEDAEFGMQIGGIVDNVPYAKFEAVVFTDDANVTARVTANGELVINPDEIKANAEDSDLTTDEYLKRVVQEEAIHAAHLNYLKAEYVKETGDTKLTNFEPYFMQKMEAVASEMTPEQVELVQGVYGENIDGARLGLEYVRMLTQQRREGGITEGVGIWEFYGTTPNPETRNYFKRAINWIRKRVQPKTRSKNQELANEASQQLSGLSNLLNDIEVKRAAPVTDAEPKADTTFISGLTASPNEMTAAALQAGEPVGIVAVPNLQNQQNPPSSTVIDQITDHANRGKKVFIDSGAFRAFKNNVEINFESFFDNLKSILANIENPENVTVVMPDIIGKQDETIELQNQFAEQIQQYIDGSFDVVIPIQHGTKPAAEMYKELANQFGENFRVGIPSNEKSMPLDDFQNLVSEIKPSRVHLLGVGEKSGSQQIDIVRQLSPETNLSVDSSTAARGAAAASGEVGTQQQFEESATRGLAREEFFEASRDERIDETEELGSFFNDNLQLDEAKAKRLGDSIQGELGQNWFNDNVKDTFVRNLLSGQSINQSFESLRDNKLITDEELEVTQEAFLDPRFSDIQNQYAVIPRGKELGGEQLKGKAVKLGKKSRSKQLKPKRRKNVVKGAGGLDAVKQLGVREEEISKFKKQTDANSDFVVQYFRNLANRMTDNSPDGKAAAQDIWSHLWEAATKWLKNNDDLSGFGTNTIARNKMTDIGRGISRRGQTFLNETVTTDVETGESAVDTGKDRQTLKPEAREAVQLVADYLEEASDADRTLSVLITDNKEATAETVAKELGIKTNAVYARKSRLKNKIKNHLEDRGVDRSIVDELMQAATKRKISGDILREARQQKLKGDELTKFIKQKLEGLTKQQQQEVLAELGIAKANKPAPSKTGDQVAEAANNKTKRLKFTMSAEKLARENRTKKQLDQFPKSYYDPITNKETLAEANRRIDEVGMDAAKREVMEAVEPDAVVSAMGIALFQRYQSAGKMDDALDIAFNIADKAKTQGQAIQILSIVNRISPDGAVLFASKLIRKGKADKATKEPMEKHLKGIGGEKQQLERIRKKAERLQRLRKQKKLNPTTELSESAALLEEILRVTPTSMMGKLRAFHTIMMLLNFKTAIRNILGNVILFVPETVSDFADATIDASMSMITGKRTKINPVKYTLDKLAGLPEPIRDFRAGMELAKLEGEALTSQLKSGYDTMVRLSRLTSQSKFELKDVNEVNSQVFDSKVMKMLEDALTLLLSPADRAFYVSAYKAELNNQMRLANTTTPTKEMVEYAQMVGMRAIYQNDNFVSQALNKARKLSNQISTIGRTEEFGLGEVIFKFTRVPGSLLLRGLEFSPFGFIRAGYEALTPVFTKRFNQREFVAAFSRATVGTGSAMTLGYMLEQLGAITGAEPEDDDQRDFEREMGFQRYSINVSALKRAFLSGNFWKKQDMQSGDYLVSYDWAQPVAMPMAMGAIASQKRKVGDDDNMSTFMLSVMTGGVKTLEEQPLVSGMLRFADRIAFARQASDKNNPMGALKAITDTYRDVPASFVPTFVNQVNQYMDNVSRNTTASDDLFDGALDRVVGRLPKVAESLPPRRTTTGQVRKKIPSGNDFFNVFFNPAFTDTIKSDPVGNELMRLFKESGQTKQFPRRAGRSLTINGEKQKLDAEQIGRYQHAIGKLTMNRYMQLMRSERYHFKGDEDRAKILADEMTDIATATKVVMFDHKPKTMRGNARRIKNVMENSGIDWKKLD